LFGIVLVAAGPKNAIPSPLDQLSTSSAALLGSGAAIFVAADAKMLRVLGIARGRIGAAASAAALGTIALGLELSAAAQVGTLAAIVTTAVAARGWRRAIATRVGEQRFAGVVPEPCQKTSAKDHRRASPQGATPAVTR
jgi:hypothetical protein